ncbi:ABC transporter ATP-binding protein [Lolliginicoccus levis]|uniref:ABC transporter ATP-binding protein n=1 Tax=Lolliginicoccus levis TaxID=2919542 RepID=UPI00241D8176|nr:ABC transporter ATP-binding protein [Lolliginicoccus levis]
MALATTSLALGYGDQRIVDDVTLAVEPGTFTVIVGPNGCGKSTLLRGMARLLRPRAGSVLLDGRVLAELPARELARAIGMLPQHPLAPEGVTVAELVARGRHPHQSWFRQWSTADENAVRSALDAAGLSDMAEHRVDELSGGQRQRAWIALALAQDAPVMLLDEPTTFLDLAHQLEVLDLLAGLRGSRGRTIIAVLHDLDLASRYADRLVVMSGGAVVASGPPREVVTPELVREVFGVDCIVVDDPLSGTPMVIPRPRRSV